MRRHPLAIVACLQLALLASACGSDPLPPSAGPQARVRQAVESSGAFTYEARTRNTPNDALRTATLLDMAQALDLPIIVPGGPGALGVGATVTGTVSPEVGVASVRWAAGQVELVGREGQTSFRPQNPEVARTFLGYDEAGRLAGRWLSVNNGLQAALATVNETSFANLLDVLGLRRASASRAKAFEEVRRYGRRLLRYRVRVTSASMTCGMGEARWRVATYVDPETLLPVEAVIRGDAPFNPPNAPSTSGIMRGITTIRFSRWGEGPSAGAIPATRPVDLPVQRVMRRGMQSAGYASIAP